jgi:tRNA-dihydrouridine synthase B
VKMRRGMDDSRESRDNFFAIFDGAFRLGAVAVTVHGRTVRQRYEGTSSREFLREVKQHAGERGYGKMGTGSEPNCTNHVETASGEVPVPIFTQPQRTVLGSGDLFTARDCLDMLRETGVDGVSVARGAIGNPWIFQQARALAAGVELPPPSLYQQRDVIAEHYRLSEEIYGPERCCRVMRKFGIKYARLHPNYLEVRNAFISVTKPAYWRAALEKWYAEDLPGVAISDAGDGYYG